MNSLFIPEGYKSPLDVYRTQKAIAFIKQTFQARLAVALNLKRVSAPLFVTEASGLNDNLNGTERPVSFDIPAVGESGQVVHSLAKWKRLALKKYGFKGYTLSTGGSYIGDGFNIEEFLFVKAYALNALEVCKAKIEWADPNPHRLGEAKSTSFSDELELLLFDM